MGSGQWYAEITEELKQTRLNLSLEVLCPVELGLTLLQRIDKGQPPTSVWALLGGYPFAQAAGMAGKPEQHWMITCVRRRLWPLRRRGAWVQALREYQELDSSLRAFRVAKDLRSFEWTGATALTKRFEVYERTLETLPALVDRQPIPARAGRYYYFDRDERVEVEIPEDVANRSGNSAPHDLTARTTTNGTPLDIPWAELEQTAAWMDRHVANEGERANWHSSVQSTRLLVRDSSGSDFCEDDVLRLNGLLHAVGMVGVGKSTLMKVLAVWAVRRDEPLRITLVVGDVAEQLRTTAELRGFLGDQAVVPVIGSSTREQHVQSLHRRLASQGHPLLAAHHEEEGFGELSTACPLDALRSTDSPVRSVDAPCSRLYPADGQTDDRRRPRPVGCPLWHACPRHGTARDQVGAGVWIATMASLVMSPVPAELSGVRLRQLELACRRSDIIVVDEADRAMMNLDMVFAPTATLVSRGPHSWLDTLHTHNIRELSQEGRLQLSNSNVRNWEVALSVVTSATNLIYSMLIADEQLRDWVGVEYFNSWTLQAKILSELFPEVDEPVPASEDRDGLVSPRSRVETVFDQFRDDPLGDNGPYATAADRLAAATQDLLHTLNPQAATKRLSVVIEELRAIGADTEPGPAADDDPLVRKLEFALLLSALHHRLDRLTYLWPQVEDAMRLDSTDNELVRRPPMDYMPLVPESPMGNVLGFQYVVEEQDASGAGVSGTLRFFRCTGVGRELLFSLPTMTVDIDTGRGGTHVLMLSGTSWAGTSTRAHVVIPVGAVLQPSIEAEKRLRDTEFTARFLYNDDGEPISLSGQSRKARPSALRTLVDKLGKPGLNGISPLREEILKVKDPLRHRALILVGNYEDAQAAADQLNAMPEWHGHVRALVADNADLTDAVTGVADDPGRAGVVRRGEVGLFARDAMAQVLVAPMLAIERGHNILKENSDQAALGVALLLTRPHPVPTDVGLSVLAVNDWESRFTRGLWQPDGDGPASLTELVAAQDSLDAAAQEFRTLARSRWGRLLTRRYAYSSLSPEEMRSFAWDQLVVLWQVIGRLVRGGVAARVVFVDAQFARMLAAAQAPKAQRSTTRIDHVRTSLLYGIQEALRPYFVPRPDDEVIPAADARLAELLYEPVYRALGAMLDQMRRIDLDSADHDGKG
ncbi:hypothetical protein [Alloactinosynnema sp. L-07]|uniref:pPIWI_RE_Z domain-containing protein n=1 Tax=Alloactinosynnema sp. L-07 TaxID=1653480 RepID=UPI00065F0B63|nr:hypothetical protein [Alloactinosynnema sp. L-07]CRK59382.1 hypothetical protein [Alloactinosynnema sp. L-07]